MMAEKNILHMVTPTKHISPFDANMAVDAGYDAVLTYSNVTLDDITGLVQDSIFSRPPKTGVRSAMFFGGKNASLALDMLTKARKALVPPFGMSFFADPAGSFTTAAAMVACVERILKEKHQRRLESLKLAIFGATGVVGYAAAVIAALERSSVTIVGYDGIKRVTDSANEIRTRFNVEVRPADGSDDSKKSAILKENEAQLAGATNRLVVADVNAVPPAGIEGLDMQANGDALTPNGTVGLGPLAIGNIKYKTEFGLFQKMIAATKPVQLDFRDAFVLARELNV
jgi:methylene-tetrahydromethanopterin dehydrogenase